MTKKQSDAIISELRQLRAVVWKASGRNRAPVAAPSVARSNSRQEAEARKACARQASLFRVPGASDMTFAELARRLAINVLSNRRSFDADTVRAAVAIKAALCGTRLEIKGDERGCYV